MDVFFYSRPPLAAMRLCFVRKKPLLPSDDAELDLLTTIPKVKTIAASITFGTKLFCMLCTVFCSVRCIGLCVVAYGHTCMNGGKDCYLKYFQDRSGVKQLNGELNVHCHDTYVTQKHRNWCRYSTKTEVTEMKALKSGTSRLSRVVD